MRIMLQREDILSDSLSGTGYVWKLEKKFERYLSNGSGCLTICNATMGIWAILVAQGLTDKDSIVATPLSWGGTIAGALQIQVRIWFGGLDPKSLSLSPTSLRKILNQNPKVKAVVDLDFLGIPSRSREISAICREHGILYILDCANSFGTITDTKPSGYYADVAVYSFGAKKNLRGGEGGLLSIREGSVYDKLVTFTQHPDRQRRDLSPLMSTSSTGLNLRIHPQSAKICHEQFDKVLRNVRHKQEALFKRYPWLTEYYGDGNLPNCNTIILNEQLCPVLDLTKKLQYRSFDLGGFSLEHELTDAQKERCHFTPRFSKEYFQSYCLIA